MRNSKRNRHQSRLWAWSLGIVIGLAALAAAFVFNSWLVPLLLIGGVFALLILKTRMIRRSVRNAIRTLLRIPGRTARSFGKMVEIQPVGWLLGFIVVAVVIISTAVAIDGEATDRTKLQTYIDGNGQLQFGDPSDEDE